MKEKDITFEDEGKLWKAADKLRKKVEVHEYKYVGSVSSSVKIHLQRI